MREHGLSRLAQAIIAKFSRKREECENTRRGVPLAELHARQRKADAEAHERANHVMRSLRK